MPTLVPADIARSSKDRLPLLNPELVFGLYCSSYVAFGLMALCIIVLALSRDGYLSINQFNEAFLNFN